jgi:hypothetical protein
LSEEFITHKEILKISDKDFANPLLKTSIAYFYESLQKGEDISEIIPSLAENLSKFPNYYNSTAPADILVEYSCLKNDGCQLIIDLSQKYLSNRDAIMAAVYKVCAKGLLLDKLLPFVEYVLASTGVNNFELYFSPYLLKSKDEKAKELVLNYVLQNKYTHFHSPKVAHYYLLSLDPMTDLAYQKQWLMINHYYNDCCLYLVDYLTKYLDQLEDVFVYIRGKQYHYTQSENHYHFLTLYAFFTDSPELIKELLREEKQDGYCFVLKSLVALGRQKPEFINQLIPFFASKMSAQNGLVTTHIINNMLSFARNKFLFEKDTLIKFVELFKNYPAKNILFDFFIAYSVINEGNKNQVIVLLADHTDLPGVKGLLYYLEKGETELCAFCTKQSYTGAFSSVSNLPSNKTEYLIETNEKIDACNVLVCKKCQTFYLYNVEERNDGRDRWEEVVFSKISPTKVKNKGNSYIKLHPETLEDLFFERQKEALQSPLLYVRDYAIRVILEYYYEKKDYKSVVELYPLLIESEEEVFFDYMNSYYDPSLNTYFSTEFLLQLLPSSSDLIKIRIGKYITKRGIKENNFTEVLQFYSKTNEEVTARVMEELYSITSITTEVKEFYQKLLTLLERKNDGIDNTVLGIIKLNGFNKEKEVVKEFTGYFTQEKYLNTVIKFFGNIYPDHLLEERHVNRLIQLLASKDYQNQAFYLLGRYQANLSEVQVYTVLSEAIQNKVLDLNYILTGFDLALKKMISNKNINGLLLSSFMECDRDSKNYFYTHFLRMAMNGIDMEPYFEKMDTISCYRNLFEENDYAKTKVYYLYTHSKSEEIISLLKEELKRLNPSAIMDVLLELIKSDKDVQVYIPVIVQKYFSIQKPLKQKSVEGLKLLLKTGKVKLEEIKSLIPADKSSSHWEELEKSLTK